MFAVNEKISGFKQEISQYNIFGNVEANHRTRHILYWKWINKYSIVKKSGVFVKKLIVS